MRAAVYQAGKGTPGRWLSIEERPKPEPREGEVLLRVRACGVCRTDLHIVEGELPPLQPRIVPGHQIVGEVVEGATAELPMGAALARNLNFRPKVTIFPLEEANHALEAVKRESADGSVVIVP